MPDTNRSYMQHMPIEAAVAWHAVGFQPVVAGLHVGLEGALHWIYNGRADKSPCVTGMGALAYKRSYVSCY